MGKDEIAYLGSDTVYEGKLSFKGTVRIEGRFSGEVSSEGTLTVGKDAQVEGTISVGELLVAGHICGEITAMRRVVVYSTGFLEGNINTCNLLTEEGGMIEGKVSMQSLRPAANG